MTHVKPITVLSAVEQVAEYLRGELRRGIWTGTLPGVNHLAAGLEVNHKTVEAALRMLESEGLLENQGRGVPRRIVPPDGQSTPSMRVCMLIFDAPARHEEFMIELRYQLEAAGHVPFFAEKTLEDLRMDERRVARFVEKTGADAWVLASASLGILKWFVGYEKPAFALFGRRRSLPIAGVGPDHVQAGRLLVRRLAALGHRRIVNLVREHRRLPEPGMPERALLDEMRAHGLPTGAYNLPDWDDTADGFHRMLDELFRVTPPTALIIGEPPVFHAAKDHLAQRGILAPADISLICEDPDPTFAWCRPTIAHLEWDSRPVVRRVVNWAKNVARGKDDRRQTLTGIKLVEGGTMGPAPASVPGAPGRRVADRGAGLRI